MARLRVAEIFASIQGEGRWVGTPSAFVRVSGCNLRCVWCDTPYASWEPEGPVVEVGAVAEQVQRLGIRHVVLTGGEPMLFEGIEELAVLLRGAGHVITIETAGTVFREVACDLMSISPKLANSTPVGTSWEARHEETRLDLDPLTQLVARYEYQLKFVVDPESGDDLPEIARIVSAISADRSRVMLMAEGTDAETLRRRQRMLVEVCLREGYALTPRLQVELFGNTRGT